MQIHPGTKTTIQRFSALTLSLLTAATLGSDTKACDLAPIALSAQTLVNAQPGRPLGDIWNGANFGNFGWLSWRGTADTPTLANSLLLPGDSFTYRNPDNSRDSKIDIGDWVQSKPGVSNSQSVRAALDAMKGVEVIVPVWSEARGRGGNVQYHVSAFARVQVIDYQLSGQNRISAIFLGYSDCGGGSGIEVPPATSN